MKIIETASALFTRQLEARDYGVDPETTGKPIPLIALSNDSALYIYGQALGPPGQYAFLATNISVFDSPPQAPYGWFSEAYTVPCGQRFELRLNKRQILYGLGSISPSVSWGAPDTIVLVTINATYVAMEEYNDGYGDGAGGPAPSFSGPRPKFLKG